MTRQRVPANNRVKLTGGFLNAKLLAATRIVIPDVLVLVGPAVYT